MEVTNAQKQIIETMGKSLLISASAGSGKTFVVIERVLSKIIKEKCEVDRLLLVTFTNAAASELKERLLKKLLDAEDEYEEKDPKLAGFIAKQIKKVPLAEICTIHSFCLNIIRDNFFYLAIDPTVSLQDDIKSNIMIMDAIDIAIDKMYESKNPLFLSLIELFKSEDNLIEVIFNLYKYYLSMPKPKDWLSIAVNMYDLDSNNICDLIETELGKQTINSVFETLDLLISELKTICEKISPDEEFRSRLDVLIDISDNLKDIRSCKTYDNIYLSIQKVFPFVNLPSAKVTNKELNEEVKNVKKIIKKGVEEVAKIIYKDSKGIISDLNKMLPIMKMLEEIILIVDESYIVKKKTDGTIDFSDCEHLALKALENDEIRERSKEKYDEIYIDEYQDTSLMQEEILSLVARENNKIMVGDIKQSIYGFRHARPDIFMSKYLSFKNIDECSENDAEAKITLSKNFRSREEVVCSINYIFEKIMSLDLGGTDYQEDEKLIYGEMYEKNTEGLNSLYKTEINIIETENLNELEEAEDEENEKKIDDFSKSLEEIPIEDMKKIYIEASSVAVKIKELVSGSFEIFDKKTEKNRRCEYRDIVILLRSVSSVASLIEDAFKEKNIPVYSDTTSGFYKTDEINLVLSILKIIDNPYNDIDLVSVMYSIVGEFTLDELVSIRIESKKEYVMDSIFKYILVGEDLDLIEKLKKFVNLIEKYRSYLNIYSLPELIIKLYKETGIYNLMMLEINSKLKCANLDAFLEIATDYDKKEARPLNMFLKYIANISKKDSMGDSPKLLGENENVVRIMTIHKSKGLEFPVVILMNTSKKYNETDLTKEILKDSNLGIGINILAEETLTSYPSLIKQMIKLKIKQNGISEELRLLYTALTRARDKVLIYGVVKSFNKTLDLIKNKMNLSKEGQKIPKSYVKGANNYLALILMTVLKDENQECIKLNIISDKSENKKALSKDGIVINREKTFVEKFVDKTILEKTKIDKQYKKDLKLEYEKKYAFHDSQKIEQKYTVTELKSKIDLLEGKNILSNLKDLKPNVLETETTNILYGTFIHKVIENLDFKNISLENIKKEIEALKKLLEGTQQINTERVSQTLLKLFDGEFANIIKDAIQIKKEYEFVIQDNLEFIYEFRLEEETLIQGVIDLYIITKEGIHDIIDFKTDRLTENELISRYKYQLYIYKRAVQIIENVEDVNMYIYSFHLNKLIKVV